nr:MAG: polyprotein [Picornavirales sp.]
MIFNTFIRDMERLCINQFVVMHKPSLIVRDLTFMDLRISRTSRHPCRFKGYIYPLHNIDDLDIIRIVQKVPGALIEVPKIGRYKARFNNVWVVGAKEDAMDELMRVFRDRNRELLSYDEVLEDLREYKVERLRDYREEYDLAPLRERKIELQVLEHSTPITLSPETDYVIKLVENLLTVVRLISKAKDKEDYALAIAVFAQCRANTSLVSVLMNQWGRIMSLNLQDGDYMSRIGQLKHLLTKYELIKKLPIFQKLYRFLMYCIGTSLFEKMGVPFNAARFLRVEEAAIKKEFYLGPDFVHCMLDTIVFISETGYQCMVTGTIDPIFHHESTYEKWIQDGELLRIQAKHITNPEPHGFTVFDFLNRMDDCIDKGKNIIKYISKHDSCAMIIRRLVADLENIRAECKSKRLAQQERKAPFAVLVHGGSGVAKSQFTKLLFYHYGKMFKLPIDDEYKYTRNAFDQYWTNFNSSQWCLQLDDIAYLHPNSSNGCDPSLTEMLQVINNVPYVPTQADLADKGKTPVRAKFVIATTNTETLNADTYFACPLAVQRRLPFIISIEPKDAYRRDGGPMIDPFKIPKSEPGEYPDLWRITVKRVVPRPEYKPSTHMGQTAEYKLVRIYEDVHSFLEWFSTTCRKAEATQDQAMQCDTDMKLTKLCIHDKLFTRCGLCYLDLQSGSTDIDGILTVHNEPTTPWVQRMYTRIDIEDTGPDRDPGYDATIKGIAKQISKMSIFHKIICMWYYCVLWVMGQSWWGAAIVAFFYGNWVSLFFMCRLMHIPEVRHIALQLLGYKAYRYVRSPKVVLFCASLVTAITIIKCSRYLINHYDIFGSDSINSEEQQSSPDLQGDAAERGSAPEPKGDKQENVWYKDHFECTPFDVTPAGLSRASWSLEDTIKYISPNMIAYTVRARTETTMKEKYGRAVCIGGHTYMFNNHCVPFETFELEVIFQSKKDGVTTNFTTLVTPGQMQRYPEKDLLFIQLPSIPPKKDIRDFFSKNSFEGRFDGAYVARSHDGSLKLNNFKAPRLNPEFTFEEPSKNVLIKHKVWEGIVDQPTILGDCGSLLLVKTAMGPMILGIHVLGGLSPKAIALSVTEDLLRSLGTTIFSDSVPNLQVGDYSRTLVELNKKATVRYIENGTLMVYGSLSGFRGKMKSRVTKTYMHSVALRDGYACNTGAPLMNSYIPWRKALLDMTRPVSHIDLTLLSHCAESYTADVLSKLTKDDLNELKVYDLNTAINGCPGLAYVDKMPRNTSAGFPFQKSKKFFLEAMEPFGGYSHPVKVTKEIENEMDSIIKNYESNRVYCPVFTASLKDEPTSFKKIEEGKTRVFCGAPMPWSLVVRMYFLSIIRLIQKNRFLFEAGPGTIAQSKEWDELYKHITQFGLARIVAGDYGKFDKRMPASVILAAFDILRAILQKAGWTDKDLCVIMGISYDVAFPTINFHGELLRCYGTNPSGHPLTVIINGIANSLYVRYCYATLHPDRHCLDFKANIALMTYGDDMIMGVNPTCHWIDHTKMQKVLADIDIEFTMAEKTAASVPFIHIDEATFLRRSWRYEPELDSYVCPIEHASIEKMLTMCVESKTISKQLQAVAVLETACREYFWYGRSVFEKKRSLFNSWIEELDLSCYSDRPLPLWSQLVSEFKQNSQLRDNAHDGACVPHKQDAPLEESLHSVESLTSFNPVKIVFKNSNAASCGTCQSCARVLEPQQCVDGLHPHGYPIHCPHVDEESLSLDSDEYAPPQNDIQLQSDEAEEILGGANTGETTSTTVVEFLDETPGTSWSIEHPVCTNLSDQQPEVELAKFLSRPVLIKTHTWAQVDAAGVLPTWNPWHLFFNSTPIKNKLNNYAFINCTLRLKFVINASPFYSGALAFTYNPLQNLNGNSIITDLAGGELMPYSQRAKVWVFPQTCEGGELSLPFFYFQNWLDLTSADATKDMGTITPVMYAPLVSATGVTGTSVFVNIYAWAENVKLHAPTTKLALQVDEFDYKPSQIASSVAKATGSLSRVPMIGPYMKATSAVASGIASVASSLGFTNVPNMDTVDSVKLQPFPHNSTCEVSVPTDRSSVDPKNEVCLDPRTVGLDGQDELDISYIAGRESYIGSAILSSTDSVDTLTLVSRVTPCLSYNYNSVAPWQFTPMGYVASMFKYWRGDIIFRFKFICTRFHKGRVRITFDPANNISTSVPDYTTVFNEVVDIGAETDIEVRVPYSQAKTFMLCNVATGNYNLLGSSITLNNTSNGLITMRVVNPLSGPVANTAIPVLVFARAADNIEFAQPTNNIGLTQTFTPYALQSHEIEYPLVPTQVVAGNERTLGDPNKYHVHFGEAITSFRPLIHRFAHQYSNESFGVATTSTFVVLGHKTSRRLKYAGYDPNGYWSATPTVGGSNAPYNYVRMNIHQMVALLFVGQRGSINHSYNIETYSTQMSDRVTLQRYDKTITAPEWTTTDTSTSTSVNVLSQLYLTKTHEFNSGTSLTDMKNQPSITMNFPYYSPFNFQFVNPAGNTLGSTYDGTDIDNIHLQVGFYKVPTTSSVRIHAWSSYGLDYNFFYFNNAPSLYLITVPTGV